MSKQLTHAFWAILPGLVTVFLLIVYLAPKRIDGLDSFMPILYIVPMFYWGLCYSKAIPYWFVFAIGLIVDAATGQPLGLTSLLNIFFMAMIHAQHKYINNERFTIKWGYFALLLLVIMVLHFVLISLFYGSVQGVLHAFIQWMLTLCCYPLLYQFCELIHRQIAHRQWLDDVSH